MLQGLRTASNTFAGRALLSLVMGVIIISFAIWGIGNIFQGFGQNHLGYVGHAELTITAYRDAYQTALQRLQQQTRRQITNEEARLAGLDRQVLERLVSDMAMDQEAAALGLSISDDQIRAAILEDPAFKGPSGRFDRDRFNEVLRDNGFSERSFVTQQRAVYLRREIEEAVAGAITAPRAALDALNRYTAETRTVDYLVLPPRSIGDIAAPSDDVLKKYFEDHKDLYRAPEYRSLVTLHVTPTLLAKPALVSDADAKARYDEVKAQRYDTPEKRDLQQIVFPEEADAQTAAERIKGGTSFEEIATERKLTPADIDLGIKTKADLIDKATADAAFSLPENGVSEPIKYAFGYALIHVTKIYPAGTKPFADVVGELKLELAIRRAGDDEINKVHDTVEDQLLSGKPLAEAAKAVGIAVQHIEGIDAEGRDKAGAPVANVPDEAALLKAAFASDIGRDNDAVETSDHGYIWFEVAKVEPPRQKSFEEVKGEVEKGWRSEETSKRLAAKAADLAKKINGGATLDSIAAAEGVETKTATGVLRTGASDLPREAIPAVFAVAAGSAGSAPDGTDNRLVFKVTASTVPPLDTASPAGKRLSDQYAAALANDVAAEYVSKVQTDVGYTINADALRLAIGDTN